MVGHEAEGVNLLHEDVGWDHVKVDELEERAEGVGDVAVGGVAVLFAPHQRRLELGELVGPQLLPGEDEPHNVLRQEGERPEIEDLFQMTIQCHETMIHQISRAYLVGSANCPIFVCRLQAYLVSMLVDEL